MISIIIPVYNGERTIGRCLRSVLSQSFCDFEVVVIDDGSTDGTFRICSEFADARIKVIHKVNGGVSSARNKGLDVAQGEYISFIDADDVVEDVYLENLMVGCNCDLSTTGFFYGNTLPISELNGSQAMFQSKGALAQCLPKYINDNRLCYPWGRLYRRDIIEQYGLRFDEKMRFAEDNVFVWQYLVHVKSACFNLAAIDYHKMDDDNGGYNLSFEEMDYVDGQLFTQKLNLEKSFGIYLKLDVKQLMHVTFLENKLVLTASALYGYFKKYHPGETKAIGYNAICNTVYYLALADVKKAQCKTDAKAQLRSIRRFLDCPISLMRYSSIKSRFLIPFIKLGMYATVIKILRKI